MKALVLVSLCCLVAAGPVLARSGHHRRPVARSHEAGIPITAQSDAIRINAVGEVISKPTPVIQKERNFDNRARNELSGGTSPSAAGRAQP